MRFALFFIFCAVQLTAVAAETVSTSTTTSNVLGTYNLILLEDYNFQGGDVEGQAFIGGDLNAQGRTVEFGSRLANTDTAIDAVTIVGDVNANGIRVLRDNNLIYGGALNASTVELNDGDDGQAIYNPDVSITDIANSLYADTAYYASLTENGTYSNGTFNYSGTDEVAVFNVSASEVFAQNSSLNLIAGSAETIIINVSASDLQGNDIVIGGGVNSTGDFTQQSYYSNILWNFYDAESIDFNNLNVKGSVLAPFADTTGGSSFDGSFAAQSYTGAREFHNFVFNYEREASVVEVPAPHSSLFLLLIASILMVTRRLKVTR